MQTLVRAMKGRGEEGIALPPAFASLERLKAKLRRGQLCLIAAASGTGKSAVATTFAIRMMHQYAGRVPTLYFSADSDRMTLGTRIGAGVTGFTTEQIEEWLKGSEKEKWYGRIAEATDHIWFNWQPSLEFDDIDEELRAYAVVNGMWPELIVVDNLKNVWSDETGSDHVRFDRAIDRLHEIARETSACVLFLHHVTGEYEDGVRPIPLSGLMGKCGKTPRLVLTLYRASEGHLGVCVVKNSNGPADASGGLQAHIPFAADRMWFGDAP